MHGYRVKAYVPRCKCCKKCLLLLHCRTGHECSLIYRRNTFPILKSFANSVFLGEQGGPNAHSCKHIVFQSYVFCLHVDAIKDYYGVHIGMYFAFLGHYTMALTLPALLGVFIWFSAGSSQVLLGDIYCCWHNVC